MLQEFKCTHEFGTGHAGSLWFDANDITSISQWPEGFKRDDPMDEPFSIYLRGQYDPLSVLRRDLQPILDAWHDAVLTRTKNSRG